MGFTQQIALLLAVAIGAAQCGSEGALQGLREAEPGLNFPGGVEWAQGDSRSRRSLLGEADYTLKALPATASGLGAGATSLGNYDPANPGQWWALDVSFSLSAPAGTTCQTFTSSGAAGIAIAEIAAQSGVPANQVTVSTCSASGGRRRLQQAGGVTLNLTFQIRKKGTADQLKKAAEAVVDSINGGDLEKQFAAKGIDMQPKNAGTSTDPIKTIQRYVVRVSISAKGPSCAAFKGSKAARQYVLTAASLTGEPAPHTSVSCADAGPAGRKKRHLILTISINKTGKNRQVQKTMNRLVAVTSKGVLAQRLLAAGVTRFRPLAVISSSAVLANPKPSP